MPQMPSRVARLNPLTYFWLILTYSIGTISNILEDNITRHFAFR